MTSWVYMYIDVQGECQFSPRRKLTWCEAMSIRLGKNWHGARPCQFSPRRKLTCPWEFVGSILTVHLNFLGSGAKFSIYKMLFFNLKTLLRENLYGNLATNNTHFKAPGWIDSHVNFNPGLNRKLPASHLISVDEIETGEGEAPPVDKGPTEYRKFDL